jgi:sterol desaturase/sphingolipid hydroxylase (fatty acid hydroxylase superfamily)
MTPRLAWNSLGVIMLGSLATDIVTGISHTLLRVLPYVAGMGVVFAALSYFSPCNEGRPWWGKKGLVTDLCYWFIVPVFSRYGRIGFTVLASVYLLGINTPQGLVAFYDHGHGPISRLPYWLQIVLYLITTEFALYWIHRTFHGARLWKYHAVHHSSEELEWISASRFHPVNLLMGSILVTTLALLAGFSPTIFLIMAPFDTLSSGFVHANLNWTLGPLKYVIASPVFHRWHHDKNALGKNFAATLSVYDWMFGTFYMPEGQLPANYGLIEDDMPQSFGAQVLYPLVN